jgi:hypothetical protein
VARREAPVITRRERGWTGTNIMMAVSSTVVEGSTVAAYPSFYVSWFNLSMMPLQATR